MSVFASVSETALPLNAPVSRLYSWGLGGEVVCPCMQSIFWGSHQQVPDPSSWKELGGKEALNFVSSCMHACASVCVCVCVHVFIFAPGVGRLTNSGVASGPDVQFCALSICAQQPEPYSPPGAPSRALQLLSGDPGHWSWKPFNRPTPLTVSWTY